MAGGVSEARQRRRRSFSCYVYGTALEAEIFAILDYIDDCIERNYTGEQKYICSDAQAASRALGYQL
jgi:hypothetical protein